MRANLSAMTIQMRPHASTVADRVRGIAVAKRVRQAELAVALGVSRMAVTRRLNGTVPFTDRELILLSKRLAVPVGAFFGEVAA